MTPEQFIDALPARQRQVVDLWLDGKTNKETAEILGISKRCAEAHRQHLHDKLSGHFLCIKPRIVNLR